MTYQMPTIDLTKLEGRSLELAKEIVLKNGTVRKSKPTKASPEGQYVWRNVVFYVSPMSRHHCMPVTDYFGLGVDPETGKWNHDNALAESRALNLYVEKIVDTVPLSKQHGAQIWGRALGIL